MADSNANKYLYSYVAAGVITVIVLVLPFWVASDLDSKRADAETVISSARQQIDNPSVPDLVRPNTRIKLERQWNVGQALPQDPAWASEIRPALIKYFSTEPPKEPIHTPPEIAELECGRDAEEKRAFVTVRGVVKASKETHVRATGIELYRKENDGGFVRIDEAKPAPNGAYEFKDLTVDPGNIYTYKLVTIAEKHPEAPVNVKDLNPAEARKESVELGPTPPVPFDLDLKGVFVKLDQETGTTSFFATVTIWDYESSSVKASKGGKEFQEGDIFLNRYKFFPVDPQAQTVTVADKVLRKKTVFKQGRRDEHPVDCWTSVNLAAPEPAADEADVDPDAGAAADAGTPAGTDDASGTPEPAEAPADAPPPPPPPSGGVDGPF